MRELFVVTYEMSNVDVAVVLLHQYILAYLVSAIESAGLYGVLGPNSPVDVKVVDVKVQDEVNELLLDVPPRLLAVHALIRAKEA